MDGQPLVHVSLRAVLVRVVLLNRSDYGLDQIVRCRRVQARKKLDILAQRTETNLVSYLQQKLFRAELARRRW